MAVTLAEKMTSENIKTIADLILFELSRRPSSGTPVDTTSLFAQSATITDEDIAKLVTNLGKAGQTLTAPSAGTVCLKTFGQSLIDKLLAANAETVKIS